MKIENWSLPFDFSGRTGLILVVESIGEEKKHVRNLLFSSIWMTTMDPNTAVYSGRSNRPSKGSFLSMAVTFSC